MPGDHRPQPPRPRPRCAPSDQMARRTVERRTHGRGRMARAPPRETSCKSRPCRAPLRLVGRRTPTGRRGTDTRRRQRPDDPLGQRRAPPWLLPTWRPGGRRPDGPSPRERARCSRCNGIGLTDSSRQTGCPDAPGPTDTGRDAGHAGLSRRHARRGVPTGHSRGVPADGSDAATRAWRGPSRRCGWWVRSAQGTGRSRARADGSWEDAWVTARGRWRCAGSRVVRDGAAGPVRWPWVRAEGGQDAMPAARSSGCAGGASLAHGGPCARGAVCTGRSDGVQHGPPRGAGISRPWMPGARGARAPDPAGGGRRETPPRDAPGAGVSSGRARA